MHTCFVHVDAPRHDLFFPTAQPHARGLVFHCIDFRDPLLSWRSILELPVACLYVLG